MKFYLWQLLCIAFGHIQWWHVTCTDYSYISLATIWGFGDYPLVLSTRLIWVRQIHVHVFVHIYVHVKVTFFLAKNSISTRNSNPLLKLHMINNIPLKWSYTVIFFWNCLSVQMNVNPMSASVQCTISAVHWNNSIKQCSLPLISYCCYL